MFGVSEAMVDVIKERYTEGCKVELVQMNDTYVQMPAGLKGTVMFVDDIGTVHIDWENGSSLGACLFDGDIIKIIK